MQVRFLPGVHTAPGTSNSARALDPLLRVSRPPSSFCLSARYRMEAAPRYGPRLARRSAQAPSPRGPPDARTPHRPRSPAVAPRRGTARASPGSELGWTVVAIAAALRRAVAAGRAVGADAARLRPLWLARVGTPDDPRPPRHQRRAVLEAAAVSVHRPLRAVRALPAVAVDDHLGGDLAQRRDLRGADRLQADRRAARAPLGRRRGRGVRGRGAASESPTTSTTCSALSRTR